MEQPTDWNKLLSVLVETAKLGLTWESGFVTYVMSEFGVTREQVVAEVVRRVQEKS